MSVAFVFPGQGSQYAGMGKDLAENFPAAREIFEEADAALGFSVSRLCFEGSAQELQSTENTQPAILTVSVAVLVVMETEGLASPDYVAGHSLGEYSALIAAGSLSLADTLRTVRLRGRYMQEAVPEGAGAMAAVMGAALSDIERICSEASGDQICAPANINSPNQVVIAGHVEAVERASELLRRSGARRVVKLNVSAPFHCALMRGARDRLAPELERLMFHDLRVPLINNAEAMAITRGDEARASLVRQVTFPVRWLQSIQLLIREGVDTFVEVGPGKVLTGLMRQIAPEVKGFNVQDSVSLKQTAGNLAFVSR